jgi:hypothetical protein
MTPDLVVVSTFPTVATAEIAQGVLDSAGIESMIRSDNAGGLYPALDRASLLVRAADAAAASAALQTER